ncbi:hypothetical protein [Abyssalbus ytuae]|uniref:Uncharacterized protein n=1 Tax=Abyssalbus ytuae TaxID=2926907 RepID=A0A9E6ZR70_9FLAO|nr:hypothetical protein [Abyssalbus ytuae]UOB18995.1 hypothetical protein MQE35_06780 [Abyssalbus ytuae]
MTTRKYTYKDVDMLLASKTIVENLVKNLTGLSVVRSTWTTEYTTTLAERIDEAIENYLGLDKRKELREATSKVEAIQSPAMRDLSFIKTQIEVDFGNDAKEILKTLGFHNHLQAARQGDQEALIQLLYTFKTGMNEELQTQITQKGTNPALITGIIDYADQLKQANVSQETLKETTKALSEKALKELNDIYEDVAGICKIASNFYRDEPLKKEQFTFSKVVANMNTAKKSSSQPTGE